jgi:hypothetical protein
MAGFDSYAKSLLHFENRVWTFAGTAQIDTAQKPFATGGSLLLDGDSDYISTPDSVDWTVGSGDFTLDLWLRTATIGATQSIAVVQMGASQSWINLQRNTADLKFYMSADGATWDIVNGTTIGAMVADTWYHVAIVRNGNDLYYYYAGTKIGTVDVTGVTFMNSTGSMFIGASGTDQWWNGHIGEVRITKGLARWTGATYTLPTDKYADDANTISLLHFDEADGSTFTKDVAANWTMDGAAQFYDEIGKLWTAAGDAQLDTAQYKWTASGLFDGTGDALTITNAEMAPGTGAFTLDFWIRHSAASTQVYYDSREAGAGNSGFILKLDADKKLIVFTSSAIKIQGTTVLVADTWYHVALVGNGGADGSRTLKAYLGGTQEGSTSTHDYSFSNTAARIGISQDGATPAFAGWMDEFRLSIGIARWTSDFTPPTAEYSSEMGESTSETTTITDSVEPLHLVDTTAETVTLTDTIGVEQTITRTFSDTATLTDTIGYLHLVESIAETATFTDAMRATVNSEVRRRRVKVNWTANHISLKFQNNTASTPFKLMTIGLKTSKLPQRNLTGVNWTANHISLKFQNNTADTEFQLQMLGLNVVELPER